MFDMFDKKNRAGMNVLCGGLFAVLAFIACPACAQAEGATSRPSRSQAESKPANQAAYEAFCKGSGATDPDEKIRWYKKALELDPKLTGAYCNLGIALQNKSNLAGAIVAYKKAIELDPKYVKAYYNLGNAMYGKGDNDGAIRAYKKAIELDPKYAKAYYNLGVAIGNKGNLDGEIRAYKKAIEINPKYAGVYNNLGIALKKKGDIDGAIRAYKKAIELNPKDTKAYYNLGLALQNKGDLAGAIIACKKAIELNPKFAFAYYHLGLALQKKGDYDGAIRAYNKAIELDPKYAKTYNNLAIAYYFNRDYDNAWRTIETARRIGLGNAIHPKFLEALKKASVRTTSRPSRSRAESKPTNSAAHEALRKGNASTNLDEKIHWFKKAIELNPKHAKAYYNLGNALQYKGSLAGATAAYKKAIKLAPHCPKTYNNLAVAYYINRDYDNAWKVIETARRMGLGNAINREFLETLKKDSGRDGSKNR